MTGVEFILLLACVAIAVLFVKVSNAKNTIRNLATDVVLLRDTPKANKLVAEYKELGGEEMITITTDDERGQPRLAIRLGARRGTYETLESFECKHVCPLRKKRLKQLEQKKPRKK